MFTISRKTSRTGYPTANQTPGFGSTFTVGQVSNDANGHVNGITSRSVKIPDTVATPNAAGLMSAADKGNIDAVMKCRVAGVYKLNDNVVNSSTGIAVKCKFATNEHINAKCIRLEILGGTTGKYYLAFVSAPYQYRASTSGGAPAGGEFDIFIRNDKGEYVQSYYNLTLLLIEVS